MSENEQRPPDDPYGSQPPTNPYGQPLPSSSGESSTPEDPSRHDPYGQSGSQPGYPPPSAPAYGSPPPSGYDQGQGSQAPQGAPYGQPAYGYGSDPYGVGPRPGGDARPGTVTAAGWITIVLSAVSTLFFGFLTLAFMVAREQIMDEIERQQEFQDLDIQASSIAGVLLAILLVFTLWSAIGVLLGIFVLRRSNAARILLVISSAMVALISLISIAGGVSVVTLIAAIAVIALLFVGGASDWFSRKGSAPYGGGSPYGGSPYGDGGSSYGGGHQQP